MAKAIRVIQSYLLYAFPFVLICMIWGSIQPERTILKSPTLLNRIAWETLSWNLMIWFSILILFLVLLVVHPDVRETTIKRLARINERDEREQIITGKAARSSFLATLSLLIFLLFVSIFSLNISKLPENEAHDGKTKTLSVGLGFSLLDKGKTTESDSGAIFETKDVPLSKSAILLLIVIWQIGTFGWSARRENLKDLNG